MNPTRPTRPTRPPEDSSAPLPGTGTADARRLVVVGHGMVGHRLVEALDSRDTEHRWEITVLAEEHRPAYDRVALSSCFEGADESALRLPAHDPGRVGLRLGDPATALDRAARTVHTASGARVPYDALVLATGSRPFVPPIPGAAAPGCLVYRTLADIDDIRAAAAGSHTGRAVVVGGGLLGLEAANALRLLGLATHVVERAPHLMAVQLDQGGGALLGRMVGELGVRVHTGTGTRGVATHPRTGAAAGVELTDGTFLETDLVVFAAGVRPRDELARDAGLRVGERGGVVVDAGCRSVTDPRGVGRRRGRLRRGPHPGAGRARLRHGRDRRRPAAGRRGRLPRRRHRHPAQTARCRSGLLRRRARHHPRRAGSRAQRPRRRHLRQTRRLRRRPDLLGGIPRRRHLRLPAAAPAGRQPAARRPLGAARARDRGRRADPGRGGRTAGQRPDLQLPRRHQGHPDRGRHRAGLHGRARAQVPHQGRNRLRLLRPGPRRAPGSGGRRAVHGAVRALRPLAGRAVRDRRGHRHQHLLPARGRTRARPRLRRVQTGRRRDPRLPGQRHPHPGRRTRRTPGHQRPPPGQHAAQRHLLRRTPGTRRRDHPGPAHRARRGGPRLRPVHQDHRRSAHRPARRPARRAPRHLAPAHRSGLRVRARLRQGRPHGQVLRRLDLVPLRSPGLGRPRRRTGTALPRTARTPQAQGRRLRLRPRVRGGPQQGLRHHRHRAGLEPLRRRQRRLHTPARRTPRHRPRPRHPGAHHRPVPDVLHPHRRPPPAHRRLAGNPRRRPGPPAGRRARRRARHRRRPGRGHGTARGRLPRRMARRPGGPRQTRPVHLLRQRPPPAPPTRRSPSPSNGTSPSRCTWARPRARAAAEAGSR